ncbi:MAG: FAD-dependent oxidoreductase [Actinobacteria bacterium]|nr:FAD-dependent oxidoreductase [Actinomycetota bacterium]
MSRDFDLIVIGAGTTGIPCAVEAAHLGAKVLLLEKSHEVGGTLFTSGGHMSGAGTKRQKERGIEDSHAEHLADIERISHGTARKDLSTLAVTLGTETIDWLDENGFEFHERAPRIVYGHEPYGVARTYYGTESGLSILKVLKRLLDERIALGGIDLRLNTGANSLIEEGGAVVGVRTNDGDFTAKNVVIATGGFGANPEMFSRLEGAPLVSAAWPTSTGDGIAMAEEVGAAIAGAGTYLPTFGGLPAPDGGVRIRWEDRPLLVAKERPPHEIYVDRRGKRWVAEDEPSIDVKEHALVGIEEMTFWTFFDSAALEASQPMVIGWSVDDLKANANVLPGVFTGNSIEETAVRMGVDPAGLEATVARYNEYVAAGVDAEFGRKHLPAPIAQAPFYAIQNHAVTLITFSGIDVDANLRVRKADGSIIPGLYAAGEALGAAATMGKSFCGGLLAMPAIAFGRHIARELAGAESFSR